MRERISGYLRQNTLAVIALVVSLTGVAYAAAPRNSVVSKSIKNGAVRTNDLANGAVTSAKTADNSLTGADIAELTGADIVELTGADIAELTGADVNYGVHVTQAANAANDQTVAADCPPGQVAVGGGGLSINPVDSGAMVGSFPTGPVTAPDGWQVSYGSAAAASTFSAVAMCMPA